MNITFGATVVPFPLLYAQWEHSDNSPMIYEWGFSSTSAETECTVKVNNNGAYETEEELTPQKP